MFDNDDKDMAATLSQMQREALHRCRFNQIEAAERMKQWVRQDARFNSYDADRLVAKANECKGNGGVFSLDDPYLRKNGQARPLALKGRSGAV
jgi:hypothetical protein